MVASLYLLLALCIAVATGWWWLHRHDRPAPTQTVSPARRYHGVMIIAGPHACEAVKKISEKRLLAEEAPLLPLPNCDSLQCQCTYRHLNDRRRSEARRQSHIDIDKQYKKHEKRDGRDRRRHSLK